MFIAAAMKGTSMIVDTVAGVHITVTMIRLHQFTAPNVLALVGYRPPPTHIHINTPVHPHIWIFLTKRRQSEFSEGHNVTQFRSYFLQQVVNIFEYCETIWQM